MRFFIHFRVAEQEKQIEELQKGMPGHPAPIARSGKQTYLSRSHSNSDLTIIYALDSGIDAEMETDSGGLSFLNVATSTPIRNCSVRRQHSFFIYL